ncbi:MAG: hypothetical protein WC346_05135 [Methanogenium sp.]|jgi:hypothetical protein
MTQDDGQFIVPNLQSYKNPEGELLQDYAEFSPKYQAFRVYRICLSLQAQQQYAKAREAFYDNLGWFTVMFDPTFPARSQTIISRYSNPQYAERYTYEQIEQLKYMRIVLEFSRMLMDASSRNKSTLNTQPDRAVELVPIGYGQIFDYEHMVLELFMQLTQIQRQQNRRDATKFFNHAIPWFGGIFDAKFIISGYIISQTELRPEQRYRKLVSEFSKLLTRKAVAPTALATLVYKPAPNDIVPHCVDDIINGGKAKAIKMAKLQEIVEATKDIGDILPINELNNIIAEQCAQDQLEPSTSIDNTIKCKTTKAKQTAMPASPVVIITNTTSHIENSANDAVEVVPIKSSAMRGGIKAVRKKQGDQV